MKAARKICGDQPVRAVDSARALRDISDPATLDFQGGAAPAEAASATEPASAVVERVNLSGDALFTNQSRHARADCARIARPVAERARGPHVPAGDSHRFTDSVGSDDYNLALSKRRAESVAAYLTSHWLKTDTLTVTGRGKADPVASNATAEGRASNRRVEIRLQH
ncbi:outer membrane protein OmpA-like peptidoglycan-associated protein [Burkholderia ambifaria]|nr:outer membrane protein OmpA-like peptidoglycan-associated protein [Burkholderia ambifaria]